MGVTFNDGSTTQYKFSTDQNAKGWCQIYPDGVQNNIANVAGGQIGAKSVVLVGWLL